MDRMNVNCQVIQKSDDPKGQKFLEHFQRAIFLLNFNILIATLYNGMA